LGGGQVKKRRLSKRTLRNWLYAYMFLAPWIIGVLVLVVYPLINSFNFSLNTVRMMPKGMLLMPVGFKNYHDLFVVDTTFLQALIGFAVRTVPEVAIITTFSLVISIMLNQKIKARGFFRSIFFLPVIIATGPVMNELVSQGAATVPIVNAQAIAEAVSFLPVWVSDPIVDMFSSLILILWNSGVQILIFLAALQKVSPALYEAAKIDGGSGWECFWKITMPSIRPMILLNAIYTVIWLATGGQNEIIDLIYDNMFASSRGYGYASAQAWTYSVAILLMLGLFWRLLRVPPDKSDKIERKKRERLRKRARK
jgi:ABC-type sugar transport system permease subunit